MNKDQPPAAFARFASSASVSSDATAASSASTHPGETPNPVHRLGIDVATKLGADNEEHVDLCIDIHGDRDALKARQAHKLRRPGEEEARSESLPIMQRSLFHRPRPTITTQALDNSELVTPLGASESPELLRECDAASAHRRDKLNLLCSALQPVDHTYLHRVSDPRPSSISTPRGEAFFTKKACCACADPEGTELFSSPFKMGDIVSRKMSNSSGNVLASNAPIAALLKMRCETSGSSYAMFWERSTVTRGGMTTDNMTVAGGYVTPQLQASLVSMGLSDTYADACSDVVLDAAGDNLVAKALRSKEAIFIENAATCPSFVRRDKAARYGIQSITFVATAGGVLEYGTANVYWDVSARNAPCPVSELLSAVTAGSSYVVYWRQQGGEYSVCGDFELPESMEALKDEHGDDKTFVSETRKVRLPAAGENMVASAAASDEEVVWDKTAERPTFKRASLAMEFNVNYIRFVPCAGGVLVCVRDSVSLLTRPREREF
jgi:hypothetical protein